MKKITDFIEQNWKLLAVVGVTLGVLAALFPWPSADCSDKEIQARVLTYMRKDIIKALNRSDNLVMQSIGNNLATAKAMGSIFNALDPKNPTSKAMNDLGKDPEIKFTLTSVTEVETNNQTHVCQAILLMEIPSVMGQAPQKGNISMRYIISPNLADPNKGPAVNAIW